MNRILNVISLIFIIIGSNKVAAQNETGVAFGISLPKADSTMNSGSQRAGKYVTDSTYYYRANLFGQNWLNVSRYKVTGRDQFGNFVNAKAWNYDTLQLNWYIGNTYEATYHDSINRSTWLANVWDLKVGVWRMSDSNVYLSNGAPQVTWFKYWDPVGYKFLRGKRVSYFYLGNGNIEKQFTQTLDTLTRKWENDRQDFYSYNTQDLMIENLIVVWDTLNFQWVNSEIIKFSYDENNLLLNQLNQEWQPATAEWINKYKAEFFYNSNGLPGERFVYEWIGAAGTWRSMIHTINLYNENLLLSETLDQYWDDDDKLWVNNLKNIYGYNAQGKKTEVIYQYWNFVNWVNLARYKYSYDENGNRTGYLYSTFNDENNIWEDYYKEVSFWSQNTQNSIDEQWFPEVKFFPNPAHDFINITFEAEIKNAFCYLFSSDGKLVKTQNISGNTVRINTSGFVPGIYVLRMMAEGQVFSQKIIFR
jgi:hypothetical protein